MQGASSPELISHYLEVDVVDRNCSHLPLWRETPSLRPFACLLKTLVTVSRALAPQSLLPRLLW